MVRQWQRWHSPAGQIGLHGMLRSRNDKARPAQFLGSSGLWAPKPTPDVHVGYWMLVATLRARKPSKASWSWAMPSRRSETATLTIS